MTQLIPSSADLRKDPATPLDEVVAFCEAAADHIVGSMAEVTIASADVETLNATEVELVPAPAAGKANVLMSVTVFKDEDAYDDVDAGENLTLKYTDSSGAILAEIDSVGFLDSASAETRVYVASGEATPINAAIVAHMLVGEVGTGGPALRLRISYKTIDLAF